MKQRWVVLMLIACLLAGCACSKTKSDQKAEIPSDTDEAATEAALSTANTGWGAAAPAIQEQMDLPEAYQFSASELNGRLTISVNAPVRAPDVPRMPVVRVKKAAFSQERILAIVQFLFAGDSLYDYTKPDEPAFDGQLRPFFNEDGSDSGFLRLAIGNRKTTEQGSAEQLKNLSAWVPATEEAFLASENDFISYTVYSSHSSALSSNDETQDADAASASFQAAKAQSDAFFEALGLSDTYRLGYASEMKGTSAYHLYYTAYVDGIETYVSKDALDRTDDDAYPARWGYETILLAADQEGIRFLHWNNPMTVEATVNEEADLLPFADIQARFEKEVRNEYIEVMNLYGGTKGSMEITVDDVRLCLLRVRDGGPNVPEGTLVPAWVFYGHNRIEFSDGVVRYNFFAGSGSTVPKDPYPVLILNAADGTIINLQE